MPINPKTADQTQAARNRFLPLALITLAAMLVVLSGCQTAKGWLGIKRYDIPQHATAQQQLDYAVKQHLIAQSPFNQDAGDENSDITIAAYRKVLEAFPEATSVCGRAQLGIATVYTAQNKPRKALPLLENLIRDYPNDDQIQVDARFQAARIYDDKENFDQAKRYYQSIIDDYERSENPHFQKVVAASKRLYMQVRRVK